MALPSLLLIAIRKQANLNVHAHFPSCLLQLFSKSPFADTFGAELLFVSCLPSIGYNRQNLHL